ncbi:MAG: sugar ABC transporter permease, partial [Oscillospiraceae bacterium]
MKISRKAATTLSTALTYIVLFVMLGFVLIPIIYVISLSFSPGSSLYADSLFPKDPTLNNYKALLVETDFIKWYINTIKAGALSAIITVILTAPTAYAFSRLRFKGRKKYLLLFLILQMFPGMMAMVAYYVLLNLCGLLDTTTGLVILYAGAAVTGNTWLLKGYFDTVPKALEEAAQIDGANRFIVFTRILLPLARPMLVLVAVFAFAAPFGDFVLSRIVLTRPENYTLALGTYNFVA